MAHLPSAVDRAGRAHEAADPAAVGRDAAAVAAPAREVAGADDLTVAVGCAGSGLRDRSRGEARNATDGERQSPRACISHRDCPRTRLSNLYCCEEPPHLQRLAGQRHQLGRRLCPIGHAGGDAHEHRLEHMDLPRIGPATGCAALPARNLKQLLPDLKFVQCQSEQVLIDADSSLEHIFFPDSGVVSVVAVYPDGSIIEMATIGREGGTGFQAVFGAKSSSARLLVQVPGTAARISRAAFVRAMDALPAFRSSCSPMSTLSWSRSWCRQRATVHTASSSDWRAGS